MIRPSSDDRVPDRIALWLLSETLAERFDLDEFVAGSQGARGPT
jgi:hypothetical protein